MSTRVSTTLSSVTGAEAFPIIWSQETTAFCLLTGLSPNLARILPRTGTTIDTFVRAGVEALQCNLTTDNPATRIANLMLDRELLAWDETNTEIVLGPVIMVRTAPRARPAVDCAIRFDEMYTRFCATRAAPAARSSRTRCFCWQRSSLARCRSRFCPVTPPSPRHGSRRN